jgi:transposase
VRLSEKGSRKREGGGRIEGKETCMPKFKEYHQSQMMLIPPSLEEKIAQDHLARYISRVVDELDTSEIERSYSELGCPAYHPKMLLKLLLYGYSMGIRSSRRIQRASREDVVFMWLAGMQEPDFRTISDFRKDRLKDIKKMFRQVLEICSELGMVRCGKISIDGTKIEANSSRYKLTYRKKLEKSKARYEEKIEEILKEAGEVDEEEDRLYGDKDGYSLDREYSGDEIRKALKEVTRKREKLTRQSDKLKAKINLIDGKLERLGGRNSFGNTDPDATLMLMKEGSLGVGYNVQIATENQLIVGYGVFQRPNDNHLLIPMVDEVESNLGKMPEAIIADKGYCSQENYQYAENRGIKAAIPPQTYDYDIAARHRGNYRYSKNLGYERLKVKMLDFLESEEGKGLMDRRKHDVEPTFGDVKHNMGFRKLLLRLMPKAATETGLVCLAHNIKKMRVWLQRLDTDSENGTIRAQFLT